MAADCWNSYPGPLRSPLTIDYQPEKKAASQKLDIYKPSGIARPYKTVMLIHGGCFQDGRRDADDTKNMIQRLVNSGYAVVSVDYRLARPDQVTDRNIFPASMCDVQDALRFLRKNGAANGLDTSRLVAFGYSSGATLADYLGTRTVVGGENCTNLRTRVDGASEPVTGVVDFFGRTDFSRSYPEVNDQKGRDCGEAYVGEKRTSKNSAAFKAADVLSGIGSKTARFLIVHGTDDHAVNEAHSCLLFARLSGAKVTRKADPCAQLNAASDLCLSENNATLCRVPGADHMFGGPAAHGKPSEADQAWGHVCPFLSTVLGAPQPAQTAKY
jgi:acetyl esterase/lipase